MSDFFYYEKIWWMFIQYNHFDYMLYRFINMCQQLFQRNE